MIRKMLLAVVGVLFALPASVDDTGLASLLHDLKKEKRGLTCMAGHFHDGVVSG